MDKTMDRMPPVHPGEILLEEFMNPLGLSQSCLAHATGMSQNRIHDIISGQQGITWDTAIRLPPISVPPRSSGCTPKQVMNWMQHSILVKDN